MTAQDDEMTPDRAREIWNMLPQATQDEVRGGTEVKFKTMWSDDQLRERGRKIMSGVHPLKAGPPFPPPRVATIDLDGWPMIDGIRIAP